MTKFGPKQEPVAWSTIVGLVLAALASYGFGVTDEAKELLVYVVPIIAAAYVARQNVSPVAKQPDTQGPPAPDVDWQKPETWPTTPIGGTQAGDPITTTRRDGSTV